MDSSDNLKKTIQEEKEKITLEYDNDYEEYSIFLNLEEDKRKKIEEEKSELNVKIENRKNEILNKISKKSNEGEIIKDLIKDATESKNMDELIAIIKNLS